MTKIKKLLRLAFDLVDSFIYDVSRYLRYSQTLGSFRSRRRARFNLLMMAHGLEKGLSMPTPRRGFGKMGLRFVMNGVERFYRQFGDDAVCCYALEVVERVLENHAKTSDSDPALVARFEALKKSPAQSGVGLSQAGGVCFMNKREITSTLPVNPCQFFSSRRSVRQFAEGSLPESAIREAAKIAQTAPSVCNRQSSRVYYSVDAADIARVLELQNGSGGFGDQVRAVFVITSDLGAFLDIEERNQAFVDGGVFAMTFALGLHSLGYGTCFLNWCVTARQDRKMHRALGIPASEAVVAILVGGCLRDEFVVAASPRVPLEEVLHRIPF